MPGELFALGFVEIDVKLQLCRNSCQVVKKKKRELKDVAGRKENGSF